MKARLRVSILLVSLSSLLFAALGNVFGNLVADSVPEIWKSYATPALAGVTIFLFLLAMYLGSAQHDVADPRKRRSHVRRLLTIVGIILAEGLSALEGIIANVVAARLPHDLKPYALPLFGTGIFVVMVSAVLIYSAQFASAGTATNRIKFLKAIQERYRQQEVDALSGTPMIAIGFQQAITPVTPSPLSRDIEQPDLWQPLPTGTTIHQLFEAATGRLLILGEPGAGKTTVLGALALDLIKEALSYNEQPIPIIFNLATWGINKQSLEKWMIEDLTDSYQIPRKLAKNWIAHQMILPLLDGLDEVEDNKRSTCVETVNAFAKAHPLQPIVICSRLTEYSQISTGLAVPSQIRIQPLTDAQIMLYLTQGGDKLEALHAAVAADADLRDVLRTPLLLSMAVLTYEDLPQSAIPRLNNQDAWRQQLFSNYVARMLKRKRESEPESRYTPEATERSLAWLAYEMRGNFLVEFHINQIEPDWAKAHQIPWLGGGCILGLLLGLGSGLIDGMRFGLDVGLTSGLIGWFIFWLLFYFFGGVVNDTGRIDDGDLGGGLVSGLLSWLGFLVIFGVIFGVTRGIGGGLLWGITSGIVFGIAILLLIGSFFNIIFGVIFGLVGGLIFGFAGASSGGIVLALIGGLIVGVGGGLIIGFVVWTVGKLFSGIDVDGFVDRLLGRLGSRFLHFCTRNVLVLEHVTPLNYGRFLRYANSHILLLRAGDGYRFTHILLRDYFAHIYSQQYRANPKAGS